MRQLPAPWSAENIVCARQMADTRRELRLHPLSIRRNFDVASLIEKCWLLRFDLNYEDDIAFLEQERGSTSIKRRHVEPIPTLLQKAYANALKRAKPDEIVIRALLMTFASYRFQHPLSQATVVVRF